MMRITASPFINNNRAINFEKSPKEIINEAPNKELKQITKDLTSSYSDTVIDFGVPDLLKYAKKGPAEREQAIKIIKDVLESDEIRTKRTRDTFTGIDVGNLGTGEHVRTEPGLLGAYELLTGEKPDLKKLDITI